MTKYDFIKKQIKNIEIALNARAEDIKKICTPGAPELKEANIYCEAYRKGTQDAIKYAVDVVNMLIESIDIIKE